MSNLTWKSQLGWIKYVSLFFSINSRVSHLHFASY